jgi:hypothetical protein
VRRIANRRVYALVVVVIDVLAEQASKVLLIEDNDVI